MINEIQKQTLSDNVYTQLKNSIINGEYKEGNVFPSENFLTIKLKVSRVVVRQALQKLRDEKFIVTYKGKGSFVANPSNYKDTLSVNKGIDYKTFKETMGFRALIEMEAIKSASVNADDETLGKLLVLAWSLNNEVLSDERLNEEDYNFHLGIVKCSNNSAYIKAFEDFKPRIIACFELMNSLVDSKKYMVDLHVKIAESLVRRDYQKAVELIRNNEEYNQARIKEILG